MYSKKSLVLHFLLSRFIIFTIQYQVSQLIPDHDAHAFKHLESDLEKNDIDINVWKTFTGFLRWDAQYFFHIAKYGYTFENTLAFFPMFPLIVGQIARYLELLCPIINIDTWLIIVFFYFNFFFFLVAATFLFLLTAFVLGSYDMAYKATIFFSYNPASIFFSAPYTEVFYSSMSFAGMMVCFMCYLKYRQVFVFRYQGLCYVLLLFGIATFTRSNGILNCGFIVFYAVKLYVNRVQHASNKKYLMALKYAGVTLILCLVVVLPFVVFQMYSYFMFCRDFDPDLPERIVKMAEEHNFVLPGNVSRYNQSWCFDKIPLAYSYVQSHYWNVGFLKYYEFKQIPNFLLAFPVVLIILYYSAMFFKHHYRNLFSYMFVANYDSLPNVVEKRHFKIHMFPFVVHAVFLTVFNVLTINVQVTTRILCSASPVLYWYCAYLFYDVPSDEFGLFCNWRCEKKGIFIKLYFISYYFIGTVMFCNYLPWT